MSDLAIHVVIPDSQVKPNVPVDHLRWIGRYIVDKFAGRANVKIIHLGDFADMASLSGYDKGKKSMEGRRYTEDIRAANDAFATLNFPLEQYNRDRKTRKERQWWPDRHITLGNHEDRITRATENDAQLEGILALSDLKYDGWTVHPFLQPLELDGVTYAHYFYNPMTGRAYGGQASTRLKTIGHSFTMGHQQTLDYAVRFVNGHSHHALVCGTCYLHDEQYLGPQGNAQWRGIVVCHEVQDGSYNPMMVSLDYLCRRYEGMDVREFMRTKYHVRYMSGELVLKGLAHLTGL